MINNEIFVRMVSCGRCLEIALVQVLGECRWQRFFFNLSVLLTGKLKMKLEKLEIGGKEKPKFGPPPPSYPVPSTHCTILIHVHGTLKVNANEVDPDDKQ